MAVIGALCTRVLEYFIPDVKIFFFAGCNAEKLVHFCPPV